MNTFISDLIQIAYQQDSAIPGYVQDDAVVMLADAIEEAIASMNEDVVDQPQPEKRYSPPSVSLTIEERNVNKRAWTKVFTFDIFALVSTEQVDIHPNWGVHVMGDHVTVMIPADKYLEAFASYQWVVNELESAHVRYSTLRLFNPIYAEIPNEDEPLCNEVPVGSYSHLWDRHGQIHLQPICGPRELGKPLSSGLMYRYGWPDGHEVRTLRKIYQ